MRCADASSGIIRRARRLQLIVLASTESMARRLKKLLVANRGEIALRIIRSARVFGLKTVAVYSAADAKSAHVVAADEAIPIGPAEPAKSYLNIAAIIATRKTSRRRRDSSWLRISVRASRVRASCRRRSDRFCRTAAGCYGCARQQGRGTANRSRGWSSGGAGNRDRGNFRRRAISPRRSAIQS